MISNEISKLYHIGSLLYATTNIYCLAIDTVNHSLVEVPQCHLDHCFCQQVAKCTGISISYDHVYHKCDVSTNINKQIIYSCPFGFSNIIVPIFKGKELIAALQAGPILTEKPEDYMKNKVLPLWKLKQKDIDFLMADLKSYPCGDVNYLVALSEIMSTLISADFTGQNSEEQSIEISDHQISSNLVTSIIGFVTSNYAENITLSDAAKYAYVNPSHLSRVFNQNMSCNFRSYLNSIRVEKSKELLANGDLSLADISNQVGFSDQSYFNKIFRKQEGMTPGQYRALKRTGKIPE